MASPSPLLPLAFAAALGALSPAAANAQEVPPAAPATAPAGEPVNLQDALARAVQGNIELQRERLVLLQVDAQLDAAQGQFDFRFSSDLTFRRTVFPPLTAEDLNSGYRNNLALSLGLVRPLETGGRVSLGINNSARNSNSRFECGTVMGMAQACTFYNSDVGLQFQHPLLRGFGADIVQANIRRQRVQRDQTLLNRQLRASNVLRDVIQAYWELAYAAQDLAIQRSAVDLAREQLRVTQAQIDVGRLAEIDRAAVEQAIGERMQSAVVAEQNVFFRSLELRRLWGLPVDPTLPPLVAREAPRAAPREVDIRREMERALEASPQLRSLKLGQRLSEIDIQTAENALRPQLDFIGTVGSTGRNREFGPAWEQTLGFDDFTWSAGLSLDLPIGNRQAKGMVRSARAGLDLRKLDAGEFELTLRDQAIRLASNVRTAGRRLELAKATVGFAEKNLEAEQARFSVGRSTNNEVLRRQQEVKNAHTQVLRATIDLLVSETALGALTGELLDRHGVALRGS
jgi:outer membrane protein TolC